MGVTSGVPAGRRADERADERAAGAAGAAASRGAAGVVVVTDRALAAAAGHRVDDVVRAALDAGATDVLLREKDLPAADRHRLAVGLRAATRARGAALWVAGDAALAQAVEADGVHLAAHDPWPGRPAPAGTVASGGLRLGRSCHTVDELIAARAGGAERVTYSPVFPTPSKPGYGPPLGGEGLAAGCRAVPDLDVVALGGVAPGRVRTCVDAGASHVALMGAVMGAADPARVVAAAVDESGRARP